MESLVYRLHRATFKMGKIRQWFRNWLDKAVERSMQRQADRLFDKSRIKYRDGDNTWE
jgi:hypothetical protein